jgi:excinuclease ABC subunit B
MAPNKTLAAQLYSEFKELFPENAVEYFISYYDYYQPEAYIPNTDTYIEKDASINDRIERLRNAATASLLTRRDVIIVASVSCIYGLGSPEAYSEMAVPLEKGQEIERDDLLRALAQIQYKRAMLDFVRSSFRVRGDVVEIFPGYEESRAIRVEFFGDEIEAMFEVDPLTGEVFGEVERVRIFPVSHYVTPEERLARAIEGIEAELEPHLILLKNKGKLLEAQRLEQRTRYDLEILRETGFCSGIENYSRHLDGREPGEPPATLLNYFPGDFLTFLDESHVMVPQIGAMYRGDHSRKSTLIDYGFRLPSAIDNRPLRFEEFEKVVGPTIYLSATPGPYELKRTGGAFVEQVIRPTGLVDPVIEIRPARRQVEDLLAEVRKTTAAGYRTLVTTLTKRMAEELTEYYQEVGVKVRYLHSDIDALERVAILRDLRMGAFDCLVGINLLREGLDLPEVALVAVLDADKEGFLRSRTSLIQTSGRAARNVEGRVLLYADKVTGSMEQAISEMERRRAKQLAFNEEHGITPKTIISRIKELIGAEEEEAEADTFSLVAEQKELFGNKKELQKHLESLRERMGEAARALEFEEAARLRDELFRLEEMDLKFR